MPTRLILAVDDDRDICEMLRAGLAMHGYAVECAASGREALDLSRSHDFDLALVDLLLRGEIPGTALAPALADIGIPVIMTTGAIDASERLAKLPYPFLLKPYRWADLLALLERTLTNSRA